MASHKRKLNSAVLHFLVKCVTTLRLLRVSSKLHISICVAMGNFSFTMPLAFKSRFYNFHIIFFFFLVYASILYTLSWRGALRKLIHIIMLFIRLNSTMKKYFFLNTIDQNVFVYLQTIYWTLTEINLRTPCQFCFNKYIDLKSVAVSSAIA